MSAPDPAGPSDPHPRAERHPRDHLRPELGLFDTTMLVVSSVIGVGIFFTPGVVAAELPDPTLFLLAWVVGGLLSLTGALANAELGAMFPRAGGDYVYLREAFHPAAGFLVGWLSFFVIYAGTVATLASGFAEGLARFVSIGESGRVAVAVAVIGLSSWINYTGIRAGAGFNNVTAVAKLVTLGVFVLLGGWLAGSLPPAGAPIQPAGAGAGPLAFGVALSPVLFTYLGWNAPVYVASEIRSPARNLPRALFLGLAACTTLYVVLNWLYLRAVPMGELAGTTRAGEVAAMALFGPVGGTLTALLILLSVLGCLNATILVGPRIAYAMAIDGLFFRGTDRVHDRRRTPHVAIAMQGIFAAALVVVLRRFPSLLDYTTFAIVLATMADVAALYVLRRRQPERPRPYRAWGYPVAPAAYLVANGAIAVAMLIGRPLECLAALAVTATGLPFLALFGRAAARRPEP